MSSVKKIFRPLYVPICNWYHKQFIAPKRYQQLFDEIKRIEAKRILEIGTWNGNRAIKMIAAADSVSDGTVEYVGFDLFEDLTNDLYNYEISKFPPDLNTVKDKLSQQTKAHVTLVKGNTMETLPQFVSETSFVPDFVFIDGGHALETIQNDWNAVSKLMSKKTVVIFDDYWQNREDQGARPIVDTIDTERYTVEIMPVLDSVNNPDFGRLDIRFAKVTLKQD